MKINIKTHCVKHIWIAYAKRLLASEPKGALHSRSRNKIPHYFVFRWEYGTDANGNKCRRKIIIASYERFRKIVEHFFDRAKTTIIQGEAIKINQCGRICAKRVERDFRRKGQKKIDWKKTMESGTFFDPAIGKNRYRKVFFLKNDFWCRIGWWKPGIKGQNAYEFKAAARNSAGTSGFKYEFSQALLNDRMLEFRYLFQPIRYYDKPQ